MQKILISAYFALGLVSGALAQTSINVPLGEKVSIPIRIRTDSTCNIELNIREKKESRIVEPGSQPIDIEFQATELGVTEIKWEGKFRSRGLKSVVACEGSGLIKVITVANAQQRSAEWLSFFSTLKPDQLECIKIGLTHRNIKYESIDPLANLESTSSSQARDVFGRCDTFLARRTLWGSNDPKDFPCVLKGERTRCEGVYAEKLPEGKLRPISKEEAIRFHMDGKDWITGQRESAQGKVAKEAAKEVAIREEKQRQAAELKAKKEAEERAVAEQARKLREEKEQEARRQAEEKLRKDQEARRVSEENAKSTNSRNSGSIKSNERQDPSLPRIEEGLDYSKARKLLIDSGWTPVLQTELTGPFGESVRKTYREARNCAGTGRAPCIFVFKDKRERILLVNTVGEVPKFVTMGYDETGNVRAETPKVTPAVKPKSPFPIPDGSAYICSVSSGSGLLMQLRYSRTSPNLASIAMHESGKVENVSEWEFYTSEGTGGGESYQYKNLVNKSSSLYIYPNLKKVSLQGGSGRLDFIRCEMIPPRSR